MRYEVWGVTKLAILDCQLSMAGTMNPPLRASVPSCLRACFSIFELRASNFPSYRTLSRIFGPENRLRCGKKGVLRRGSA